MPIPLLLHSVHAQSPIPYQAFGPWIVPWRITSTDAEYQALRTTVGLADMSIFSSVEVRGADRVSFLHRLLTNDIKRLSIGAGCQAALLDANGKLIATLIVLVDDDTVWLLCDAPRAQVLTQTLERYVFSEQIQLINHERQFAAFALHGPRVMELLANACGAAVSLPGACAHVVRQLNGLSVWLVRFSVTGDPGALILVRVDEARAIWQLLQDTGRPHGLELVGWDALTIARIEAGVPLFGLDMDDTNLLPETGLETVAVSDSKGCYVGQEIIARLATYGSVNKKLMGLRIDKPLIPHTGDPIHHQNHAVGWITSSCRSLALNQPLALGYLKRGWYQPDTPVHIITAGQSLPATVTALPFIPATHRRSDS